ncbi:MAG: glycoside hydrolase family 97 protein [Bacteroidota bacterium]
MHRTLVSIIAFLFLTHSFAETFVLKSPDGKNRLTIKVGSELTYELQRHNKVVLDHSKIAVQWDNGLIMNKEQLTIKKVKRGDKKGSVKAIYGPSEKFSYAYNEVHLIFEEPYDLYFRIYNQGVAYKFVSRLNKREEEKPLKVIGEVSTFNFPGDPLIYYPQTKKFQNSFEENYLPLKRSAIPPKSLALTPALIKSESGPYLLISEANLRSYPGMFLKPTSTGLTAAFPKHVKKESQEFLGSLGMKMAVVSGMQVRRRDKFLADTHTDREFPWRVVMVADDAAGMANNNLIYALSPKLEVKRTNWIKPGKVAWDWYHAWKIPDTDFKPGINTETYKYYIDFAARNNFQYINLDEGWTHNKKLLEVNKDIDIENIVDYGKQKNVGVFIWMIWWVLDQEMEKYLDQFQKWGIAGIKVDFMDRDDQRVVDFMEKLAKEAAKRKILINYHGAYKPTGLAMAYPNIINREGLVGLENNKFSARCTPEHNLTLPFIRNVLGPMDYTPGAMRHVNPQKFRKNWKNPSAMSTRVAQLAMYVVYYGPLQMISDAPPYYPQEALEYLSEVPTTWDESICLAGEVGEFAVMARRKGRKWYIAGLTANQAKTFELDITKIPGSSSYNATIYKDGENLEDIQIEKRSIRRGVKMTIDMKPTGGFIVILE